MNYITSFERLAKKEGVHLGESNILLGILQHKFKVIPETYRQKIEQASNDTLLKWGRQVLDSENLDDVFKI